VKKRRERYQKVYGVFIVYGPIREVPLSTLDVLSSIDSYRFSGSVHRVELVFQFEMLKEGDLRQPPPALLSQHSEIPAQMNKSEPISNR